MFSHPKLPKRCQARISPKFLKPEMRKHWQGSKFLKSWHLWGVRSHSCSEFGNLGEIRAWRGFAHIASHPRLPTSHDPLLTKSRFGWIMGGGCVSIYYYTHTYIYMIPVLGSPTPPPPWYPPPPTLPKPKLCDCAHFSHMRAPKATTVTRIASQDVHIFQARLSREGAKAEAINCHEDRVPCDCRHFRKRTPTNKAAVPRTVFPDRPDPCDS